MKSSEPEVVKMAEQQKLAKVVKVGHKMTGSVRVGPVAIKAYEFDKRRVFRSRDGQVLAEIPFSQMAYVLSVGQDKSLWFSPYQLGCLRELASKLEPLWEIAQAIDSVQPKKEDKDREREEADKASAFQEKETPHPKVSEFDYETLWEKETNNDSIVPQKAQPVCPTVVPLHSLPEEDEEERQARQEFITRYMAQTTLGPVFDFSSVRQQLEQEWHYRFS